MIAGAQYGGPIGKFRREFSVLVHNIKYIAMIRDDRKVLLLQKQQPIKPTIYMYTSAGKLIEQIQVIQASLIRPSTNVRLSMGKSGIEERLLV